MAIITKTAAQWVALPDYILAIGDTGYESDTYKRKIGNGITPWKDLKYKDLFRPRRDTRTNWLSKNPVLGEGEFVIETDTGKYKVGDGMHPYSALEYGNKLLQSIGNDDEYSMSQKAITDALGLLADRVVNAKDIVPFDGSSNDSLNVKVESCGDKLGDIIWSGMECMFLKKPDDEQVYYTEWEGDYPSRLYNGTDGYPRKNQIFQCADISYVANGEDIQILNVVPIYQVTGASTSGTMSQAAITRLFNQLDQSIENVCGDAMANSDELLRLKESLVGKIVIDLGTITDPDQQLNITDAGVYRYITLGPNTPGKPRPQYQNTLIVTDSRQYLFSNNGFMIRSLEGSAWSQWHNILSEISDSHNRIGDTNSLQTEAKDNLVAAINENYTKNAQLEAELNKKSLNPTGLKFDNSTGNVVLVSPILPIGLDDFTFEWWGEATGGDGAGRYIIGATYDGIFGIKGTSFGNNTIGRLYINNGNSFDINKSLPLGYLHHVVVVRKGTDISIYHNGKLITTVANPNVIDFNRFQYKTQLCDRFSQGRVFNFAADDAFVKYLFNGGRCDKLRLSSKYYGDLFSQIVNISDFTGLTAQCSVTGTSTDYVANLVSFDGSDQFIKIKATKAISSGARFRVEFEAKGEGAFYITNVSPLKPVTITNEYLKYTLIQTLDSNKDIVVLNRHGVCNIQIRNIKISVEGVIAEYLPESIHSNGVYDTSGQGNHGLFNTIGDKPQPIYKAPYQDYISGTTAPTEQPTVFNQMHTNTTDGNIRIAKGVESILDWKLLNLS